MSLGGGGGGDQTITQTSITGAAEPYYEQALDFAAQIFDPTKPYEAYGGQRVAGAQADSQAAYDMIRSNAGRGIVGLPEAMAVSGSNALAGQQLAANRRPYEFSTYDVTPYAGFGETNVDPYAGFAATKVSPYAGFSRYQGTATEVSPFTDFSAVQGTATEVSPYAGFSAYDPTEGQAEYSQYDFGDTRMFDATAADQYMSPYIQKVLDRQLAEARRQFDISQAGRDARTVQSGAFGGSRQGVEQALANEALERGMGDTYAAGMQSAFENAQRMFDIDRAAEFARQRAQAGELGRVESGRAGETARLDEMRAAELGRVQSAEAAELARTQGISVAEAARVQQMAADEQARVQAARAAENARVQGITVDEAARIQQMNADEFARVQAAQAAELARVQGIGVDEAARIQAAQAAELARTQGISVDEAARVQAARAAELGRVQDLEASELGRVQSAQAAENSQAMRDQLQALGFSSDEAARLVGYGEAQRAATIQDAQMLDIIGKEEEARRQLEYDLAAEDFYRQQNYPADQLNRFMQIITQTPQETQTTQYQTRNPVNELFGAGLAGLGLYKGVGG